jgi:hypothetical protein
MHLRRACSKEQRQLAAGNRTASLLDALTLFPQRPAADPAAGVTKAGALRDRIVAAGAALVRAAGDYDTLLIARYGAALRTCPGDTADAAHRESLDALTVVDLRDFQGLDGAGYEQARASLAAAEARAAEALRGMPPQDCDAVLALGQLLMELLNGKLEPWTREHRRVGNLDREFEFNAAGQPERDAAPTRELATSIAGNFVTVVATELQLTVFPETAPRIKAIAEAEGTGPG